MQSEAAGLWPAILGSLSFRRSPCVHENCPACLSGEQHPSHVLYGRHNGRRFAVYVPEDLVPEVRRAVENGRALQAEILLLLAADDPRETDWRAARPIPGKLFLVGDPKQSIYRFRRADVALYEEVKERLLRAGAELVHLTTSFRAPLSIQSFVNSAFASAMAAGTDGSHATYVPLEPSRAAIVGQPTLIALPVP